MAGATNTGVVGYISNPVASFPKNSITIDIFGNTFYRDYAFGAGDDTGVYWNDNISYSKECMLFFTVAMGRSLTGKFSYGNKLRSSQSFDIKMQLPVTSNGKIDVEFIDSFIAELQAQRIAELQAQRIAELQAYLTAAGLTDYTLTEEERKVLEGYRHWQWMKFNLEKLYGKSTRGKRLKGEDRVPGKLPFVTAGEAEEGVSAFIGNNVEVFSANTTTIDMFGSAKYRNYAYGGDDHIAVVHTESLPRHAAIFVTTAIHKSSHNGQFSYSRNFYASDADELEIMLPVIESTPDYASMSTFISAIKKLVIKDVVQYADRNIKATESIVSPSSYQTERKSYAIAAEPVEHYGAVDVLLPDKDADYDNLVLMYAIGPAARANTQQSGKIALGIKEQDMDKQVLEAYLKVKAVVFHYWKNEDAALFRITVPIRIVEEKDIPQGYLIRQAMGAKRYLLIQFSTEDSTAMNGYNILRVQRAGSRRYLPFVTTMDKIKE